MGRKRRERYRAHIFQLGRVQVAAKNNDADLNGQPTSLKMIDMQFYESSGHTTHFTI